MFNLLGLLICLTGSHERLAAKASRDINWPFTAFCRTCPMKSTYPSLTAKGMQLQLWARCCQALIQFHHEQQSNLQLDMGYMYNASSIECWSEDYMWTTNWSWGDKNVDHENYSNTFCTLNNHQQQVKFSPEGEWSDGLMWNSTKLMKIWLVSWNAWSWKLSSQSL